MFCRLRLGAIAIILTSVISLAHAAPAKDTLRVMTFNMMCDFCGNHEANGDFYDRLGAVADTINRHDPDLVSLQEIRTRGQIQRLRSLLREKYTPIFAQGFFLSYTDPTLLIRESRFKVLTKDGFWLGPNSPSFGLGWKLSFPRRVEFAELEDKISNEHLIFVGTHFDNNPRNREPSAEMLVRKFASSPVPVIFGGDTNLRPDRGGYLTLTSGFRDTFREVLDHPYVANRGTIPTDGCNLEKAPTFPECRVDHILLSKNSPWVTKSWSADAFKYFGTKGFISDHRAIVVDLERASTH